MLLRFGVFELDPAAQEFRRGGVLVKLSPQQLRVLHLLAERGGQVCTREEIQREIRGTEVYVDSIRSRRYPQEKAAGRRVSPSARRFSIMERAGLVGAL